MFEFLTQCISDHNERIRSIQIDTNFITQTFRMYNFIISRTVRNVDLYRSNSLIVIWDALVGQKFKHLILFCHSLVNFKFKLYRLSVMGVTMECAHNVGTVRATDFRSWLGSRLRTGPFALRHGIQNSMEALLGRHPAHPQNDWVGGNSLWTMNHDDTDPLRLCVCVCA